VYVKPQTSHKRIRGFFVDDSTLYNLTFTVIKHTNMRKTNQLRMETVAFEPGMNGEEPKD